MYNSKTKPPAAQGRLFILILLGSLISGGACSASGSGSDALIPEAGEGLPGGETTNTLLFGSNALSRGAENMSEDNELMFFSGNAFFKQPWVTAPSSTKARDGLGPLFNMRSCAGCHFNDGRGRPPLEEEEELTSMLFRLSVGEDEDEMPVGDPRYGGQLQPFGVTNVPAEGSVILEYNKKKGEYPDGSSFVLLDPHYELQDLFYGAPSEDLVLSPRVAPAMQGLGLLEAIDEERLRALADEDDEDGDGISGRVRMVPDLKSGKLVVGRFGWKAEQPSLRQQSAGAFLGDMGLTTQLFPEGECGSAQEECLAQISGVEEGDEWEVSVEILDRIEAYSRLLAVPARSNFDDPRILEGKELFTDVGCADCHTARHETGKHELAELSNQVIFPYTDLLLHDMGEELADGAGETRVQREWRTPPLWALRFYEVVNDHNRLLHDGRARGVEEAILWHGGESEDSRDDFMSLSKEERTLVVEFVGSL